jgi:hypothetical protein
MEYPRRLPAGWTVGSLSVDENATSISNAPVLSSVDPSLAAQTTVQSPAPPMQGSAPSAPASNLEQDIDSEVAAAGNGTTSLREVDKELSNPISSIWALQFQQNTYWLNKPERNVVNLLFQSVLPVSLTANWNLITRLVIPVFTPFPTSTTAAICIG